MAGRQCGRTERTTEGDLGAWMPEVPHLKIERVAPDDVQAANQVSGWVHRF